MGIKKYIKLSVLTIASISILGSCSTSNEVAGNGFIQKRKYTKGYHIDKKNNWSFRKDKKDIDNEVVISQVEEMGPSDWNKNVLSNTDSHGDKIEQAVLPNKIENKAAPITNQNSEGVVCEIEEQTKETIAVEKIEFKKFKSNRRKMVQQKVKELKDANSSSIDIEILILVILAIVIPPLAVYLYDGVSNRFWLDLVLWLVGIGLLYWLLGSSIAFLGGVIAIVYALLIVLGEI